MKQLLHKDLAPLQGGGPAAGAEDAQALLLKRVNQPPAQGAFGPHHGEIYPFPLREIDQGIMVVRGDCQGGGDPGDSGIGRSEVDGLDSRGTGQAPGQGMLPAPPADKQNFHFLSLLNIADMNGYSPLIRQLSTLVNACKRSAAGYRFDRAFVKRRGGLPPILFAPRSARHLAPTMFLTATAAREYHGSPKMNEHSASFANFW